MEVAVLQFSPLLFSTDWLSLPEMAFLKRLFKSAGRGIRFTGMRQRQAARMLMELIEANGIDRLTKIIHLLDLLGKENDFELLASPSYTPLLNHATEERLLTVCQYIHEHFNEPIKLVDIARLANMNTTSFCRFFKKSTGQSCLDYVNDLRIGKACNLLLDKKRLTISQIAHESGFNSQTLFNRCFLRKKKITPREFRRMNSVGVSGWG